MTIVYPINGKNERMGSLFSTPKHLLLHAGKKIIVHSVETLLSYYPKAKVLIVTNENYYESLNEIFEKSTNVSIQVIGNTGSQVETLRTVTVDLTGPVMFVDCDIVPINVIDFDKKYPTVFTFYNTSKLLNYSNFKANQYDTILDCNEKQKYYKNAGAGIYYFPEVEIFNRYSTECRSVSECIKLLVAAGMRCKLNTESVISRFGTLQDIYIDNFSFRKLNARDLSTGFTSNKVYKDKGKVKKIGTTVSVEKNWYEAYTNKKQIPKVLGYSTGELVMEYLKRDADINLDDILEVVDGYKSYKRLNELKFSTYIDNIRNHLRGNTLITNGNFLLDRLSTLTIVPTFCHGDLSIMNIIPTSLGLKLIDPLYSKDKFGSYELDIAKLCFSFKFYKNDSASFNYIKQKVNLEYLDTLVAAEAVRVASYKTEYSFIAENLINELETK